MTTPSDETMPARRLSGWYGITLVVAVLVLALTAAIVLVISDDARWLRLGVVAALWSALVGAFAAARYRKQAAERTERADELRRVYELELECEIAARREYELELEAKARQRTAGHTREDLAQLRAELRALRENLEALLGGEVLVERVALRAESTRMRSLPEQARRFALAERNLTDRVINGGENRLHKITAAAAVVDANRQAHDTQLMPPIRIDHRKDKSAVRADEAKTAFVAKDALWPQPAQREGFRSTPQQHLTTPTRKAPPEPPQTSAQSELRPSQGPVVAQRTPRPSQDDHRITDVVSRHRRPEQPITPPQSSPQESHGHADPVQKWANSATTRSGDSYLAGQGYRSEAGTTAANTGRRHRSDYADNPDVHEAAAAEAKAMNWQSQAEPQADEFNTVRGVDQRTGAHGGDGTSVSELLAAYGTSDTPRRRRRKDD